jgi:hypothetical protein
VALNIVVDTIIAKQGDQKIGRKFAQILGKVAQTVAKPKIAAICS